MPTGEVTATAHLTSGSEKVGKQKDMRKVAFFKSAHHHVSADDRSSENKHAPFANSRP